MISLLFFFFQAEDGIRDGRVTGVQTCALPISGEFLMYVTEDNLTRVECRFQDETIWLSQALMAELFDVDVRTVNERSEERRVGKECRSGGWHERSTEKERKCSKESSKGNYVVR